MEREIEKIKQLSADFFDEIRSIRHHLHRNPELSFQEYETAQFIESVLASFGITNFERITETGITFILKGNLPGKTIAIRADMDALPIKETNKTTYSSQNEGVMHACGHDVHMSCMLGAIKILSQLKDQLQGGIKFIFQPGEELAPGGASKLIEAGILKNPRPSSILGQHVMPLIPVGKVGFRSGQYMASADEIYLKVIGKGGHAAMPENLIDPILIASHIIVGLQQIVSRRANPRIPTVLSFGDIHGYGATNVIPDEVSIQGTFRTFDETWRKNALELIKKNAAGIADSFGGVCEVNIVSGYPFLINDPEYTNRNKSLAVAYLGKENVEDLDLWMASEDFAFYTHHVPGCFYRLGTRNEAIGITSGVHTPTFDIDDNALQVGMGLMAWLAFSELAR